MPDPQQSQSSGAGSSGGLTIPAEVQQKFGPLIELIKGSESMNNEERQYWINILPIMTPEQLKNLEEILTNEKSQLQAIDEKYGKEAAAIGDDKVVAKMEEEIKRKRKQRETVEKRLSDEEGKAEDNIMEQIQNF